MTETDTIDFWSDLEEAGRVDTLPDEAVLVALAAVREEASVESRRVRARRPRGRRTRVSVVAGLLAAAVAVGLVRLDLGSHEIGAPPAAAAVLERAARAAAAEDNPVVGPGEYLEVTLVEESWVASSGPGGHVLTGADGRAATHQERRTRTIWIPADRDEDWIIRDGSRVLRYNTTDRRFHTPADPSTTSLEPSWSKPGSPRYLKTYDPAWYASLPRDPKALMRAISATDSGDGAGVVYAFQEVYSEVLRSGVAPADIRSALFDGLAETHGMVVENHVRALDGRDGVAIGAKTSHWRMIFDADTGRYLGERATDPTFPDTAGLDPDKTTWLTSVTTTVVSSAPTATRR